MADLLAAMRAARDPRWPILTGAAFLASVAYWRAAFALAGLIAPRSRTVRAWIARQ